MLQLVSLTEIFLQRYLFFEKEKIFATKKHEKKGFATKSTKIHEKGLLIKFISKYDINHCLYDKEKLHLHFKIVVLE